MRSQHRASRVWRLVRGYVCRREWQTIYAVGVAAPLVVAWTLASDTDAPAWFLDFMRSLVAASPFVSPFFRSPEVVGRPVARRDLWRAQWLVGTVGVTAAVFVLRLVVGVTRGDLQTPVLAQCAVADFIGTVVSAGMAAAIFSFQKPPALRTLPAAVTMFTIALAIVLGAPLWSPYLRALVGTGVVSQVWCGLGALCLAFVGVRAVPSSLAAVRQGAVQWYDSEASGLRIVAMPAFRTPAGSGGDGGRGRWIARKLRSAALVGAATVLVSAVLAAFVTPSEFASLTFVQGLAGQLVDTGDPMAWLPVAFGPVIWAVQQFDGLRLMRVLPLSRLTIATTITVGIVVSLSVSLVMESLAYRAGFGLWPPVSAIPPVVGFACVAAASKTVRLLLPNRAWTIGLFFAFAPIAAGLGQQWTTAMPAAPAAIMGLGIVVSLLRIDIALLERSSRLYRPSPALL